MMIVCVALLAARSTIARGDRTRAWGMVVARAVVWVWTVIAFFVLLAAAPPIAQRGPIDPFEVYLAVDGAPADGFSAPTRADQPGVVYAVANGKVVAAAGGEVAIEHTYYENHLRRTSRSTYAPLAELEVVLGEDVERGIVIGRLRPGAPPKFTPDAKFVREHSGLFVPQTEPVLILVEHDSHRAARYERGVRTDLYEVAFGQAEGAKEVQGDLRTPKGMYFVAHRHRGDFEGRYGAYYGGHWIKVNYPNAYDAARGVERGLISEATAARIAKAWRRRQLTVETTRLGGGIGFHGWARPWSLKDGGGLSWGCIVMHGEDITALYDRVPIGTMVVIR